MSVNDNFQNKFELNEYLLPNEYDFKSIEDLLLNYQKEFIRHIQAQVIFSDNPIRLHSDISSLIENITISNCNLEDQDHVLKVLESNHFLINAMIHSGIKKNEYISIIKKHFPFLNFESIDAIENIKNPYKFSLFLFVILYLNNFSDRKLHWTILLIFNFSLIASGIGSILLSEIKIQDLRKILNQFDVDKNADAITVFLLANLGSPVEAN